MKNDFRSCLLAGVLILCSCSETEIKDYSDFTEKRAQSVTERTIQDLVPVDSLIVAEDIPEFSLTYLELSDSSIFSDAGEYILKLDKQDLSRERAIIIPEGRGPGEAVNFNVLWFKAGNEGIVIYDRNAQKTMVYNLDGTFRSEFLNGGYQIRTMALANDQVSYYQVMPVPGREYAFYEVERSGSESVVSRQFQPFTEGNNLMAYRGTIEYHNGSFYFAGYSEPILRRYDLSREDAELVFSRAVIDDYDSEANYETPEQQGGLQRWRFTSNAKFASEDIAVDDDYIYSVRHHNDQEEYKYLDIYSVEDGSYVGSFRLKHYPQYIAVDEEYIFTIEESGDTEYLVKYQMPGMYF